MNKVEYSVRAVTIPLKNLQPGEFFTFHESNILGRNHKGDVFLNIGVIGGESVSYGEDEAAYKFVKLCSGARWSGNKHSDLLDYRVCVLPAGTVLTITVGEMA